MAWAVTREVPLSLRQARRREIFETVLADLPSAFPKTPASAGESEAARRRLAACLDAAT